MTSFCPTTVTSGAPDPSPMMNEDPPEVVTMSSKFLAFVVANSLLIGILCAIGIAAAYPKLGAVYLAPKITATYICVIYIFLLSGISLKTREVRLMKGVAMGKGVFGVPSKPSQQQHFIIREAVFISDSFHSNAINTISSFYSYVINTTFFAPLAFARRLQLVNALKNYKFNASVQIFNLFVVSSLTYALTRFLLAVEATSDNLAEGLVITSCLPMTINMVIVLTKSSGGDEASAVFNAAFGNLLGVFLTPPLVLMYLGESDDINFGNVLFKLSVRVLLPLAVGQVIQYFLPKTKEFVQKHKVSVVASSDLSNVSSLIQSLRLLSSASRRPRSSLWSSSSILFSATPSMMTGPTTTGRSGRPQEKFFL